MKSPTQTTLPGVRDWSEPQDVINGSLAGTLADAARDGYDAARMLVIRDGYRVTFQRKPIVNTGDSCGDQHKHPVNIVENQRNLLTLLSIQGGNTFEASRTLENHKEKHAGK